MTVRFCACTGVSFEEILRLHRAEGLSLQELKARTGCCEGCTNCEPYVLLTLRTGVTDHPVLTPHTVARILGSA